MSHADWGVYTCEANNTIGQGRATVMLKRNNCLGRKHGPNLLACLEIPIENGNENIFQKSSFDTEHEIMIYGRRKHKKCSEDLSNFGNIIEDFSKSKKGNNMRVFNTATTFVNKISPILFLTFYVVNI